ncbi:hypothetical protein BLNAU_10978 [Blattamonas nauphoetae]|uniref:Uncharacterized protein n=1 Tax=Blattamonas nauphoetae TaxID=2049346 RepID=A0ABQ9XRN1_9EUKA|nr:hypothetical protein BLNAU_10978 [Blattamonas nauphoetae]
MNYSQSPKPNDVLNAAHLKELYFANEDEESAEMIKFPKLTPAEEETLLEEVNNQHNLKGQNTLKRSTTGGSNEREISMKSAIEKAIKSMNLLTLLCMHSWRSSLLDLSGGKCGLDCGVGGGGGRCDEVLSSLARILRSLLGTFDEEWRTIESISISLWTLLLTVIGGVSSEETDENDRVDRAVGDIKGEVLRIVQILERRVLVEMCVFKENHVWLIEVECAASFSGCVLPKDTSVESVVGIIPRLLKPTPLPENVLSENWL